MQPLIFKEMKDLLLRGLVDDGYALDWTSLGVSKGDKTVKAEIIAKADGIFFGAALARVAESISSEMGLPFEMKALLEDGARVHSKDPVFEIKGSAIGILTLERPMLNLASYFGGIATRTRGLVDRVEAEWKNKKYPGKPPRVTSTRKILPHYRDGAIAAVLAGGGHPHRVNLAGGVLIKENHIAAAGSIRAAVAGIRAIAPHGLKVEVEVRNLLELKEALTERVEVVMFDNFAPGDVLKAVKVVEGVGHATLVECSGGISEESIAEYTLPGVHLLSVGGLTHSVTALDLSLLIKK